MKNRYYLTLTEEAATVLETRTTDRKRGDLVSRLLIEYDKTLATESALLNLDQRVRKIEDTLAVMIAETS